MSQFSKDGFSSSFLHIEMKGTMIGTIRGDLDRSHCAEGCVEVPSPFPLASLVLDMQFSKAGFRTEPHSLQWGFTPSYICIGLET